MTPETRVGLVTILALVLIIGMVAFLRGGTLRGPQGYELHVVMRDATGLEAGTPVRMSGVTVGQVSAVGLTPDKRARATLRMHRDVQVPAGARFQPATSGLIGERYLAITPLQADAPALAPGTTVQGEDPLSLERIGQRLEEVSDRVLELVGNANALISDPQMRADLREALRNARDATALAKETLAQARIVASTVRRASDNIEATSMRVREVVDSDVAAIAGDLRAMAENLEASSVRVKEFVDETSAGGKLSADIRETAAALRDTGQRIRQMAEDLQGAVNQENVAKVREIIDDARVGVKEARAVVQQAGGFLQRIGGAIPSGRPYAVTYEVWYSGGRGGHDLDFTLFPEGGRSYRLGVHDIGAGSRMVLQVGGRLNPTLRWRAGIYESEVGLGLDYRHSGPLTLSLDAYNVNLFTVDALARYQLSRGWGLTFGGKDLLRSPAWLFGVGTTF